MCQYQLSTAKSRCRIAPSFSDRSRDDPVERGCGQQRWARAVGGGGREEGDLVGATRHVHRARVGARLEVVEEDMRCDGGQPASGCPEVAIQAAVLRRWAVGLSPRTRLKATERA